MEVKEIIELMKAMSENGMTGFELEEGDWKLSMKREKKIVDEYREKEIHISDEEAEQILWLCNRKMDISKIENREEYLPLLFKDEVKNYLFRCSVNATTFLRRLEAEGICVQNAV